MTKDELTCGLCGSIDHTTGRHPLPEDPDARTALAALRDLLAENEGARRNGLAGDGRGWFRTDADRTECYAVAASLLPLFEARWEYGVRYNATDIDPAENLAQAIERQHHPRYCGPVVRRLVVRHHGKWAPIPGEIP